MHPQVEVHIVTQEPAQSQRGSAWDRMQLTPLPAPHVRGVLPVLGAREGAQTFLQAKQTVTARRAVMCRHREGQGTPKA